jgi:hypothetical protein
LKAVKHLVAWLVSAGLMLGMFEIGLRFAPTLIPLTLLKRYYKDLRVEIAQQQSLWNESQMWELARDDGGPSLTLFKPNSQIAYDYGENEKSVIQMDDQGFCNPPRDSYQQTKIDIVAIGDSFTWCVNTKPQVTWVSQIGELSGLSVYNLGRGGVGPYPYLQILKHFGLPKRPDYVVMNIYEGNDLRDSDRYQRHVAAAQEGQVLYRNAGDRSERELDYDRILDRPILRDSYAINFLLAAFGKAYESTVNAYRRAIDGDAPTHFNFRYRLRFPEESIDFNIQNADESEVRYAKMLKEGEADLSVFDEALRGFVSLAKEHDFTPILIYSPSAYSAYADFVEFDDPTLEDLMPWFSQTQRQYFADKAEAIGCTFVDLTPALQSAGRSLGAKELLYNPINVHFTEKGNRVVAEALAEVINVLEIKERTKLEP